MVVMPFLLGNGKHATLELAEVLEDIRTEMPQVQLFLADGLGADAKIADLVVQRVRSLGNPGGGMAAKSGPHGILLIKAGTKTQFDDCLWLEELGRMVEQKLGSDYAVAVAQSHYGDPTMEAGAAKLVKERGVSSITCVPYLFFPGMILQRNIIGGMKELEETYPGVPLAVTPPLCVDQRVVAVAADRVREVWDREDAGESGSTSRP